MLINEIFKIIAFACAITGMQVAGGLERAAPTSSLPGTATDNPYTPSTEASKQKVPYVPGHPE